MTTTGEFIGKIGERLYRREGKCGGETPAREENDLARSGETPAREEKDFAQCRENPEAEGILQRGRRMGWIEEQDLLEAEDPIERRSAARIVHLFLKRELGEADEADWGSARELRDLYDCRTCADHIAQIYAKGIMKGVTEHIFGARCGMDEEEAAAIVERIFDGSRRLLPKHESANKL